MIPMLTEGEILKEARSMKGDMTAVYRHLHRHPEVAHKERQTNLYIRKELDDMGVSWLAPADNITIAVLDSGIEGATVGLRCDTDALPVKEETGLPYASETEGVMHACGHDAHMAIGLGAISILKRHPGEWRGRVKAIFQPAEEGENGADQVIATGLVDDVDVFFAIHVWSPYESGTLHVAPVAVSAAVNMFTIRLRGKGGHGATPERCADAIVAGASLVTSLQTVVSRAVSPMEPAVLTIGSFHGGTAGNIIAQEAVLKGTIRTLREETRAKASESLKRYAENTAHMYGCEAEVEDIRVSDVVRNDPRAAKVVEECARRLVSADAVGTQQTMMLGDDFANYGRIAPYCYAQLGIADSEKRTDYAHHSGSFRTDEDALPLGTAWMASVAARLGSEWKEAKQWARFQICRIHDT